MIFEFEGKPTYIITTMCISTCMKCALAHSKIKHVASIRNVYHNNTFGSKSFSRVKFVESTHELLN